jgi:hypothetical protein
MGEYRVVRSSILKTMVHIRGMEAIYNFLRLWALRYGAGWFVSYHVALLHSAVPLPCHSVLC